MTERRSERGDLLADADRQIGARLRELRRARGLTQAALGDAVGVASQQVAKYETGENAIGASRLWLIARALGIGPQVFFDGMDRLLAADGPPAHSAPDQAAPGPGKPGAAVASALEAQQDGVALADIFRRISNRRTRDLLLTLSRELARKE